MPPRSDHPVYASDRPILPASEVKPPPTPDGVHRGSVLVEPFKQLPKRKQVTAVACRPCKARKSKCNGARPTCIACIKRGQPDECEYDINSDQRRTAALKDRIQELRKETDDLKIIIMALARDRGEPSVHRVVEELIFSGFLKVDMAAKVLKDQDESLAINGKRVDHAVANGVIYHGTVISNGNNSTAQWPNAVQSQHITQNVYPNGVVAFAGSDGMVSPTSTIPDSNGSHQYWHYQRIA